MKEQFCNYEISLKLKELGFNEPCLGIYDFTKEVYTDSKTEHFYSQEKVQYIFGNEKNLVILAPLWQQAIDWFREAWNIQIEILWRGDMNMFCYKIGKFKHGSHKFSEKDYRQFEEARELAIREAIKLISK